MKKYVDEKKVRQAVRRAVRSNFAGLKDEEEAIDLALENAIVRAFERADELPDLVGRKVAGELLGVHPPHVHRYVESGRLRAIEVDESPAVYLREEVETLAKELEQERADRAERREEGEAS